MNQLKTTCIMCPIGCALIVSKEGDNIIVDGNSCPRGRTYGKQEITQPKRMVTSLVITSTGEVLSCKTSTAVPKEKVFNVLAEIKKVVVIPPVLCGQVLISNVCDTGIDIIATANTKG